MFGFFEEIRDKLLPYFTNINYELIQAGRRGDLEDIVFYIKKGANINSINECENSALSLAVSGNHYDCVKFLLIQGANPNHKNEWSQTPLILAVKYGYKPIVELLLKFNVNRDDKDKWGQTALSLAKQSIKNEYYYDKEILKLLQDDINGTQKCIIESTLKFVFDAISELKARDAIRALKLMIFSKISKYEINWLKKQNIWDYISQVRDILSHPCPQNRSTNYPYFGKPADHTMVVYKDDNGKPAFEKKGLLSLTARNDSNTSITKEAVTNFIHKLINEEIAKQVNKLDSAARKIQFWYRHLPNKRVVLPSIKNQALQQKLK